MQRLYKDLVEHEVADSVRYRAVHGSYDQEKCRKIWLGAIGWCVEHKRYQGAGGGCFLVTNLSLKGNEAGNRAAQKAISPVQVPL